MNTQGSAPLPPADDASATAYTLYCLALSNPEAAGWGAYLPSDVNHDHS